MAAHQAPPSLGFSRQEHWSGLPFPSPMHGSGKWKWSHVRLLATPWTAAYQAPPSMGFSRQEYWSGVPLPSPGSHSSIYIIYNWQFGPLNLLHLFYPVQPTVTLSLFSTSVRLFSLLFCLLDYMNNWNHMIYFSVWLISLSIKPSGSICVIANSKISFFFLADIFTISINIFTYIYYTYIYIYIYISSLFIYITMGMYIVSVCWSLEIMLQWI